MKDGDVLLAYNGRRLNRKEDLKVVAEGVKPIGVDVWREGRSSRRDLAPGKLGVVFDPRPAPAANAAHRKLHQVLAAARSGDESLAPLPGTRYEVEALAQLFKSDDRPINVLLGTDASEPELVTLSACETALGRDAGGEGFVGFTQALLISGARSVCLSLWRVDDKAPSLLMSRFYQNLLGKRHGLSKPVPKAEALQEAKQWLRSLTAGQIDGELAALSRGDVRPLANDNGDTSGNSPSSPRSSGNRPYDHPYFWAPFVLVGDPD